MSNWGVKDSSGLMVCLQKPGADTVADDCLTNADLWVSAPLVASACAAAMQAACGADRDDVFACAQCSGDHQRELQSAGCDNDAIAKWCAGRLQQPPLATDQTLTVQLSSVLVGELAGSTVLAVRYGWPLGIGGVENGDTCCPFTSVMSGVRTQATLATAFILRQGPDFIRNRTNTAEQHTAVYHTVQTSTTHGPNQCTRRPRQK